MRTTRDKKKRTYFNIYAKEKQVEKIRSRPVEMDDPQEKSVRQRYRSRGCGKAPGQTNTPVDCGQGMRCVMGRRYR